MSKTASNNAGTPYPKINIEPCLEETHKSLLQHSEEQKDRLKAP